MQDFRNWVDTFFSMLPPITLAIVGGIVNLLNSDKRHSSISFYLAIVVTSGFVGLITFLFISEVPMSPKIRAAVVGVSGCSAREVLEILQRRLLNRFRLLDDQAEKGNHKGQD